MVTHTLTHIRIDSYLKMHTKLNGDKNLITKVDVKPFEVKNNWSYWLLTNQKKKTKTNKIEMN